MIARVACIVEGHGDVAAVPILVRRIAEASNLSLALEISPSLRVPRNKIVQAGEVERAVELAARKTAGTGAVLIVLDAEGDCPAERGPALLERARAARGDVPIAVVLAKQEFESWFLAAARSLRGRRDLPLDLDPPPDPESIRGAKEWLRARMPPGRRYRETLDQPALTAVFDLEQARKADSFNRCWREIRRLLGAVERPASAP